MSNSIKNWNKDTRLVLSFFVLVFHFALSSLVAQTTQPTTTQPVAMEQGSLKYEEFEMVEGDTTYVMKKYFLLTYLSGENRDQPKEEADKIQRQHLEHMNTLSAQKKICIAGPFGHDGPERGIIIFNAYSLEEAEQLASQDPAVKAGRLRYTLHPIWLAKGSALY